MTTYPLSTLACTIDATGISSPAFEDIIGDAQYFAQQNWGSDIYIAPDSQDASFLAVWAKSVYDSNQATIAAYNQASPATAIGVGLSSVVKVNGIRRQIASYSTASGLVTGQANTIITNGYVIDQAGNQWTLPTVVTIPSAGSITVTITCTVEGTITAATGTITQIGNYTPGWQSFTNTSAAVPGDPVEQDGQLRQRQSQSTSLAAITPRQAIQANIANVAGVTYVNVYENDTQAADVHGVPPHAIAAVVAGGAVKDIATAIAYKKSPGTGSYGTTNYIVIDSQGVPDTINFFVLTYTQIYYKITIEPLTGFVSTTETLIQDAINQYINTLPDSTTLYVNRLNAPANLSGTAAQIATSLSQTQLDAMSATYDVVSITIGLTNSALGTSNIIIPFGTSPQTSTTNGSVVTVP